MFIILQRRWCHWFTLINQGNFLLLLHYWARPGQGIFYNGYDVTSLVSLILKINALPRCGPIQNFAMEVERVQNPLHFYTKYVSTNDLVMLLCCTELGNHLYPGTLQGFTFSLIPNDKGFHHGHILIETERDNLACTELVAFHFINVKHDSWLQSSAAI